ncbi:Methyltransferase type 12 [Lasiodiplodia theobromae]|uniref:Methyltransferase type 12 n=1 Tax=Lasiodiplodia theobromae TaxID=45133 RepID=UPI0015C2D97C|nr:Methyltransferase type 12 [Lasiodiplodia theobromae]KAF4539945.1 Methyltransferase type 12 [Lasiodiplodia theobromae]
MTQPSLTTTFDTSLIDLAALPGTRQHRRRLRQEKQQQSSQQFGSFSTTEPDTEDDEDINNGADDFAEDVPSQAAANNSNDFLFTTSGALARTPALSSDEDSDSGEENAPPPLLSRPPLPRPPLASPQPPRLRPTPKRSPVSASAAAARASSQAKRASATPTSSSKHPQPSSSPTPSSPSSPPTSVAAAEQSSRRPPAKRRKMARDASSPSTGAGTPSASASASLQKVDPVVDRAVGKTATPVRHLDNVAAYDAWAAVYDSDGNILQSVDDLELEGILPGFLESAAGKVGGGGDEVFRVLDLGCGTGRNTEKVVRWWEEEAAKRKVKRRMEVTGVDASKGMLEKAKGRLIPLVEDSDVTTLNLLNLDPFASSSSAYIATPLERQPPFHAVVSTLVLEHLPLATFFRTLAALLAPGAIALITNMHPDMGAVSQAGFVSTDADGKQVKVRGKSWAHGIRETVEAATEVGLTVVDVVGGASAGGVKGVRERSVDEELIKSGRVGERGWKWVGTKVWYGFVVNKADGSSSEVERE